MDNIILIFMCLMAGLGMQHIKAIPANAHVALNQFIIYISLPAISLYYIPKIALSTQLLYPVGIAWIGFLLSWLFFAGLGKLFNWPKKIIGCLVLTGGLGNTSFIGFPVIEALYGKEGLKTALLVDQPGSFVVLSTLGILVAVAYSGKATSSSTIARKILLFPPFIGFAIAFGFNIFGYDFIAPLQSVFSKLGSTVATLALVAVGLQLKIERKSRHWGFLSLGLFFKLLLTPLFFLVLYKFIFNANGITINISIMEAAMAPMITAAILASAHGLKPKLAGMMIGVGIPLSFITLAVWYIVLHGWQW